MPRVTVLDEIADQADPLKGIPMIYAKISFILDENAEDAVGEFWFSAANTDMPSVYRAADNVCRGYFLGSGHRAAVITLTRETPEADVLTLAETRAAIVAAMQAPAGAPEDPAA